MYRCIAYRTCNGDELPSKLCRCLKHEIRIDDREMKTPVKCESYDTAARQTAFLLKINSSPPARDNSRAGQGEEGRGRRGRHRENRYPGARRAVSGPH